MTFVPTAQDWASYLSTCIKSAGEDGFRVYIKNDCCDCSRMDLIVFKGGFDGDGSEAKVDW